MEANRFIAPEDAGRGRMALAVLRDDHYLFDLVTKSLITVAYMLVFLMVAGAVFGAVAATFGLPVFVIYRHYYLVSRRRQRDTSTAGRGQPSLKFVMFIMGSGGHTTEMVSMIERSIRPMGGMYRRYIVNEDDGMTRERVKDLEERIGNRFAEIGEHPGLFDIKEVQRARKVHQSWLTTPLSAARSLWSVFAILFSSDSVAAAAGGDTRAAAAWRFPGVVVTNGPGTGFLFLLAAHLLKIARCVPEDYMNGIFVESFAKVRTLSLTGKLIHWTNVADRFIVQHRPVADRYGKELGEYFVVTPAEPHVPFVAAEEEGDKE